jgi:hypothetical protein
LVEKEREEKIPPSLYGELEALGAILRLALLKDLRPNLLSASALKGVKSLECRSHTESHGIANPVIGESDQLAVNLAGVLVAHLETNLRQVCLGVKRFQEIFFSFLADPG